MPSRSAKPRLARHQKKSGVGFRREDAVPPNLDGLRPAGAPAVASIRRPAAAPPASRAKVDILTVNFMGSPGRFSRSFMDLDISFIRVADRNHRVWRPGAANLAD